MEDLFGSDSESEIDNDIKESISNNKPIESEIDSITNELTIENNNKPTNYHNNDIDDIFGDENDNISNINTISKSKDKIKVSFNNKININDKNINYITRLPNVIKIQSLPFDPKKYNGIKEKNEFDDSTGAVIRWRYKVDSNGNNIIDNETNKPIIESNSRLIRLSDGSYHMVIGSVVFQAHINPTDNSFIYLTQHNYLDTNTTELESNNIDNKSSSLESIAPVQARLVLQASSLSSDVHSRLAKRVSGKYSKKERIVLQDYESMQENPELLQKMQAKEEEKRLRLRLRMEQRDNRQSNVSYSSRRPSMSSAYLDDNEDQYDTINVLDMKRNKSANKSSYKYMNYDNEEDDEMADFIVNDDDQYDDEDDDQDNNYSKKSKAFSDDESDGDDDDDDDEDGDEDEEEEIDEVDEVTSDVKKSKSNNVSNKREKPIINDTNIDSSKKKYKRAMIDSDDDE